MSSDAKKRVPKGYRDILKKGSMNISINVDQVKLKNVETPDGGISESDSIRHIISKYNSGNKDPRQPTEDLKFGNGIHDSYQGRDRFQSIRNTEIKEAVQAGKLNNTFFSKSRAEVNYNPPADPFSAQKYMSTHNFNSADIDFTSSSLIPSNKFQQR